MAKGNISVHTDNLLPIIKKWLYSDSDIFVRELVSNAQDAIMKLKKLTSLGEADIADCKYEILISVDKNAGTLKIIDNGIGMTEEEVEKYINQVAFSGAEEFLSKYSEEKNEDNRIIGHFGLGFYSAFMASKEVEIDTLSYVDKSKAVHWVSDGGTEYEITDSTRTERGTEITLHLSEEFKEYLEVYKIRETRYFRRKQETAHKRHKPTLAQKSQRVHRRRLQGVLSQSIFRYERPLVLDTPQCGFSLQSQRYFVFPQAQP